MYLVEKLHYCAMDELDEAECYAKLALEQKTTKPDVAAKLYRLSEEEIAQADTLMSMVMTLCDEKKREGNLSDRDAIKHELELERYHKVKASVRTIQAAYKM